jgi:outer membrane immunogenic protein
MKRILIAAALALAAAGGQALAADLPPPPAPAPRAPATYVPVAVPFTWTGIYIGVNGGYNFGTISPGAISTNGFLVGSTLGGNYQFGSFVLGLEGDIDYNSMNNAGFQSSWLGTARGRAGYAWDHLLLFATGGGAFAGASVSGVGNTTMIGWTVGGGLEYAFTQNWTAKAEYLYVTFPNPVIAGVGFKDTDNVIRAGVNYKFW